MVYYQALHIQHMLLLLTLSLFLLLVLKPSPCSAVPLIPSGSGNGFEYKRYCSNTLSDAIRLICGGRYNSLSRKFPDSVGSGSGGSFKRFAPDEVFHRPSQSGPIHECCRRPCGYAELKMYCAPD